MTQGSRHPLSFGATIILVCFAAVKNKNENKNEIPVAYSNWSLFLAYLTFSLHLSEGSFPGSGSMFLPIWGLGLKKQLP